MIGRARPPRFRSLEVEPAVISRGEQVRLRWATRNAESVEIVGVGVHGPSGELVISPERSGVLSASAVGPAGVTTGRTRWVRVIDDLPIATIAVPVPVPQIDPIPPINTVRPALPTAEKAEPARPFVDTAVPSDTRLVLPPLPSLPELPALPAGRPVVAGRVLRDLVRTVAIDEVDTERLSAARPPDTR